MDFFYGMILGSITATKLASEHVPRNRAKNKTTPVKGLPFDKLSLGVWWSCPGVLLGNVLRNPQRKWAERLRSSQDHDKASACP